MNTKHYQSLLKSTFIPSISIITLAALAFWSLEPKIGQSAESSFVIEQEILSEVSFSTLPANIEMNGSLNGITGGTANGSTTAVVMTNNSTGYTLEIRFEDNGEGVAMVNQLATQPDAIKNHPNNSGEPLFNFNGGSTSTSALFGYSVSASDSSDLDPSFLNNGTNCNTGSLANELTCWMTPTTDLFTIIDREYSAPDGATTTINFRVVVPDNPVPGVESGIYTATATLIATVK